MKAFHYFPALLEKHECVWYHPSRGGFLAKFVSKLKLILIGWGIIWKLHTDVPQHYLMFSTVDILSFERSSPTHSFCSTWYFKMHPHPRQNHYDYWSKTTYLFLPGISSKTELPSYRPIFFVTWKSCDICKYLKNDGIDLTKARQRLEGNARFM